MICTVCSKPGSCILNKLKLRDGFWLLIVTIVQNNALILRETWTNCSRQNEAIYGSQKLQHKREHILGSLRWNETETLQSVCCETEESDYPTGTSVNGAFFIQSTNQVTCCTDMHSNISSWHIGKPIYQSQLSFAQENKQKIKSLNAWAAPIQVV